jgi:altronate hydrolase
LDSRPRYHGPLDITAAKSKFGITNLKDNPFNRESPRAFVEYRNLGVHSQARSGDQRQPVSWQQGWGLTTILEKSLGATARAGSTNLVDVIKYAEAVTAKGFVFMDTPGFDPVSASGQVAGGANAVCFTTGRGSVFGCKPAPSTKIANTPPYTRMEEDMDVNCGTILDGEETVLESGQRIFDHILRVASGERTKSELFEFGSAEFAPWPLGVTV